MFGNQHNPRDQRLRGTGRDKCRHPRDRWSPPWMRSPVASLDEIAVAPREIPAHRS
jgi:hypothetical protein